MIENLKITFTENDQSFTYQFGTSILVDREFKEIDLSQKHILALKEQLTKIIKDVFNKENNNVL
jgi:hypothetical protein